MINNVKQIDEFEQSTVQPATEAIQKENSLETIEFASTTMISSWFMALVKFLFGVLFWTLPKVEG